MSVPHINGHMRLGIVTSGFWVLISVSAYFLGIWLYPSFVTNTLSKLYTWVEGAPIVDRGIDFKPLSPTVDSVSLTLFVILPLIIGWIALCVIPRSIRWVRDGYHHETKPDA
jgi:hypothetical protein